MLVKKLSKNRNDVDSNGYVEMKNIDTDVQENGDNVITINDQTETMNRRSEPVRIYGRAQP
jgi:hypothetical protein